MSKRMSLLKTYRAYIQLGKSLLELNHKQARMRARLVIEKIIRGKRQELAMA